MITTGDIKWLAGFIEGEGSFYTNPYGHSSIRVSAGQKQLWPLQECKRLLGGHIYGPSRSGVYHWAISSSHAAGIMMTLFCLMSPKRQDQIKVALARWLPMRLHSKYKLYCLYGHYLSGDNLSAAPSAVKAKKRVCKICRYNRGVQYRARKVLVNDSN